MAIVTCFECKKTLNKQNAIKFNSHYYHNQCYSLILQRQALSDYVCALFHIKAMGPVNWRLRKNYNTKGIDDVGILNTLRYMYEIKKIPLKFANERIGKVEQYYCEAEDYWQKEKNQHEQIVKDLSYNIEKEKEKKIIKVERQRNVRQIQLLQFVKPESGENDGIG